MKLEAVHALAREQRLYPAVILSGATQAVRQTAAIDLARILLCAAEPAERACGACRACTRVAWPSDDQPFHPDLHVLERDRPTVTSAEATKAFLRSAYQAPFEARGQVFVVAEAESLTLEAGDALLKLLEEPPRRTPRHFFLLAGTRRDLLATVRSRSLSIFLGAAEAIESEQVDNVARAFGAAADRWFSRGAAVDLLLAAGALGTVEGFKDARARRPWATAAAAVARHVDTGHLTQPQRRALLETAAALLDAPRLRLRGIPPARILEGLVCRHLRSTGRSA